MFLPGFKSDMTGAKALDTEAFCAASGVACLRLDYSGHGHSGGRFEDGTIGRWTDDALCLLDRLTEGTLLLLGSSMGGWIALLAALARPARVAALIGIAAAPDFTETLMWEAMTPAEQRHPASADGVLPIPSQYGDPYNVTLRAHRGRPHPAACWTAPSRSPARSGCCRASAMRTCRGRPRSAWRNGWRPATFRSR